jgi:hypothetical protein
VWSVASGLLAVSCAAEAQRTVPQGLAFVAEVRIGDDESGPAFEFTELSQILVAGDAVYVAQTGLQEIRVFDSRGRHLQTIGRRGGGPGEFDGLQSIGFVGDTLWAIDTHLRRVTLFSATGKLLMTLPFESVSEKRGVDGNFFFTYPVALLRDGSALGFGGTTGVAIAAGRVTKTPILRMTRTGKTLDTLGWVPIGNTNMILRSTNGTAYRTQPFSDAPITAYSPVSQRIFVVNRKAATSAAPSSFLVTALQTNGDTLWSKGYAYTPERMDGRLADSVRDSMHRAYGTRFPRQQIDDALFVPAYSPPVSAALAGEDGTLWLRGVDASATEYTVIGADGTVVARAVTSRRVHLKWAAGRTAWGEELDNNDVPILVRYRVATFDRDRSP